MAACLLLVGACEGLIGADFDADRSLPGAAGAGATAGFSGSGVRPELPADGGEGGTADEETSGRPAGDGGAAAGFGMGGNADGPAGSGGAPAGGAGDAGAGPGLDGQAGSADLAASTGGVDLGSGGGAGAGGRAAADGPWACSEPTPELDPDGDLLNDACDDDQDEDGIANSADSAPRDPFYPPLGLQLSARAAMPGVMLADACVKAALAAANTALATAGLPVRLPASLEHQPPVLPTYLLRPWDEQQGYWVGGPDATPGAPLHGAELKLIESSPARLAYHEAAFNDAGLQSTLLANHGTVRGTPTHANLFVYGGDRVYLIGGSYEDGDLLGVAQLTVRVGSFGARTYPNATCPDHLGRWALSYAPRWQAVEPQSFTYMCLDGAEAHFPSSSPWTRDSPPEECTCRSVFGMPGVRSTVVCEPAE